MDNPTVYVSQPIWFLQMDLKFQIHVPPAPNTGIFLSRSKTSHHPLYVCIYILEQSTHGVAITAQAITILHNDIFC